MSSNGNSQPVNSRIQPIAQARQNTYWHRLDVDGQPLRAPNGYVPPIREAESETAYQTAKDWHFGLFDMQDPEQRCAGLTLQEVMDACANHIFILVERHRYTQTTSDNKIQLMMYVEWIETYNELNPRFLRAIGASTVTHDQNSTTRIIS